MEKTLTEPPNNEILVMTACRLHIKKMMTETHHNWFGIVKKFTVMIKKAINDKFQKKDKKKGPAVWCTKSDNRIPTHEVPDNENMSSEGRERLNLFRPTF